jgi:hypothetical protein
VPLAEPQLEPTDAEQVHDTFVKNAGSVSVIVAPVAMLGPLFDATIVYVMAVPGTTVVKPSVLVIAKSAVGVSVSMSVAVLLFGFGSVTPLGAPTVAVFANAPCADAKTVAFTVYVAVPPTSKLAVVFKLPVPLAAPQLEPTLAAHVHVTFVKNAGNVSATVAPFAILGPLFVATIVYVIDVPGTTVVTPSVLLIAKSATKFVPSTSVALLLFGFVSVTPLGAAIVAVFVIAPLADPLTVAFTVYVAVPPTSRLTVVFKLPVPLAAPQLDPLLAEHVHDTFVSPIGNVSTTSAFSTALGPAFATPIVYVNT